MKKNIELNVVEEPMEKEEVELLLEPKVFRCRWRTGRVKFEDDHNQS